MSFQDGVNTSSQCHHAQHVLAHIHLMPSPWLPCSIVVSWTGLCSCLGLHLFLSCVCICLLLHRPLLSRSRLDCVFCAGVRMGLFGRADQQEVRPTNWLPLLPNTDPKSRGHLLIASSRAGEYTSIETANGIVTVRFCPGSSMHELHVCDAHTQQVVTDI